ncbi:MAG: HlyD family secretion protein [Deltaproteobacteria bacterium]|nr:HlyD family secretion protein [Deltaproteobacteria bacterium]
MNEEKEEKIKSGLQNFKIRLLLFFITLGIALFVLHLLREAYLYEETENAQIETRVYPIVSRVSGFVKAVLVQDNQGVHKNDLLIELNPQDIDKNLDQVKAAKTQAEANLTLAEAQKKSALALLDKNDKDLSRFSVLVKQEEISKKDFDAIQASQLSAQAQKEVAEAQISSAQAILKEKQAQLEGLELQKSYTQIFAPDSGEVSRKNVEPGQFIQNGQMLMAIVDSQNPWVLANFKETQLKNLHVGQKVEINIDQYPSQKFEGHIESMQLGTGARFSLFPPENATGNYIKIVQRIPVKILFDQDMSKYKLAAGISVTPKVKIR